MAKKPDSSPGLTANGLCRLTGVRPQTRATWVARDLLRADERYGQLDLIEQTLVKALLDCIPKSQVAFVWSTVRSQLRDFMPSERDALVWDPEAQTATITRTDAELSDAVRHGRPVHVLPLGELVKQARGRWQIEVRAAKRARGPVQRRTPGSRRGSRPAGGPGA